MARSPKAYFQTKVLKGKEKSCLSLRLEISIAFSHHAFNISIDNQLFGPFCQEKQPSRDDSESVEGGRGH